jgi:hypothetical protein
LNATIFFQRLLKRGINFSSLLLKPDQRCNEENKEWSKKTSAFSTLFPNQTHNVRKNEMIRKPFVKCKQKWSINQLTIQKVKTIQNSKEIKDPLSNKHSRPKS